MSKSFRELGVSRPVVDALAARKIESPFRIQELVLPDALAGLDVLARSPTGSGKTLAFAVPIAERIAPDGGCPSALVLVPTRELAAQVTAEIEPLAKAKGLTVAAAYGGLPLHAQAKRAKRAHVLVATPGRLEDLAQRRLVDLGGVRILVLDEADRMLDMGFKPQVDKLVRRMPQQPPDDVLLGHARRRGRQPRTRVHEQPVPLRGRRPARRPRRDRASLRRGHDRHEGRDARRAPPRVVLDARLRPDEARRGAARHEARPPRSEGVRDARGHVPERAAAGAQAVRVRARSRCSSQPTSPPAGSTSTTSRT